MSGHRVEASRTVSVDPETAFHRLLGARLTDIFRRRYAAFPAVVDVTGQPDDWGVVGQTRTIVLTDGARLRETLTDVDPTSSFSYRLDELEGPLRHFVQTIDGLWTTTPHEGGTRISWSWTFYPKAAPARLTTNVIGRMWAGYAERALAEVEQVVTRD